MTALVRRPRAALRTPELGKKRRPSGFDTYFCMQVRRHGSTLTLRSATILVMRWLALAVLAACGAETTPADTTPDPWVGTWHGTVSGNGTSVETTFVTGTCGTYTYAVAWPHVSGASENVAFVLAEDGHGFPGPAGVEWTGRIELVDGAFIGDAQFGSAVTEHLAGTLISPVPEHAICYAL